MTSDPAGSVSTTKGRRLITLGCERHATQERRRERKRRRGGGGGRYFFNWDICNILSVLGRWRPLVASMWLACGAALATVQRLQPVCIQLHHVMKAELGDVNQLGSVHVPGRRRSRSCDAAACISVRWRRGRRGRSGTAAPRPAPPLPDAATGPDLQTHFLDYITVHSRGILGNLTLIQVEGGSDKSTLVVPSCCAIKTVVVAQTAVQTGNHERGPSRLCVCAGISTAANRCHLAWLTSVCQVLS